MERIQKSSHENHNLTRLLRTAEADLRTAQQENKRIKEELQDERRKLRSLHVDKLSAERKAAECLAEKSRLEV